VRRAGSPVQSVDAAAAARLHLHLPSVDVGR
jgi:hypothetical protein